jgi:hypothetical protein
VNHSGAGVAGNGGFSIRQQKEPPMKLTYADVLTVLPVDATLQDYLNRCALPLPPTLDWTDAVPTSKAIITAIESCADTAIRDAVIAGLQTATQLAHPKARAAMFQAAMGDAAAVTGLSCCSSDLHRAFWLLVHHPKLFETACDVDYVDSHVGQAQQIDLGVRLPVRRDTASMDAFCAAIREFYKKELHCGDVVVGHLMERVHGTQLVTIHAKDLARTSLEFDGGHLQRRVGHPSIHMALEYSSRTGVARTLIKGGEKYHRMLAEAFAEHLLGVQVEAQRLKPPPLDLSGLRSGFHVPQAHQDGFAVVQLKSISVVTPDKQLRAKFDATLASQQQSVAELMAQNLPNDNPLVHHWEVTAATINLYYPPSHGRRARVVSVEVTSRGRLNLHKFDDQLRKQLEGYLVEAGILRPEQTLTMAEVDIRARPDLGPQRNDLAEVEE